MDYRPSVNIAPTDVTPVVVSGSHFDQDANSPVIYPMMWGMIPPWHKVIFFPSGINFLLVCQLPMNCKFTG